MGKPTLLMVSDIPVVLPAPFDELPPIRQALVIRREREIGCAMGRGDKVAAARIALALEDRMGITTEQRVAVMQPADKIDAMIEQALVLGMTGASRPPRRGRRLAPRSAKPNERAELARAVALNAPLKPPAPNETVKANQAAAAKQRELSAKARDRRERKSRLTNAKLFEDAAQRAWDKQIEEHWRKLTDAEIAALGDIEDHPLRHYTPDPTEVSGFIKDEHGALVRDNKGLPILVTERAKARRRKSGIEWLASKDRLNLTQVKTATDLAQILADAAKAEQPGRGDETGVRATTGQGRASPGPADWKLEAMQAKAKAEHSIASRMPDAEGAALWKLLVDVCYHGETIRDLAKGDDWESCRLEERFKVGLALVRYGLLVRKEVA